MATNDEFCGIGTVITNPQFSHEGFDFFFMFAKRHSGVLDMFRCVIPHELTAYVEQGKEIEIYGEWNRLHALHDADLQQKAEVRERESAERRELYRQQAESAMNALDALADLAKAKLKAVENGA